MKKAVITGATSGIGRALAVELHGRGYSVGATGRRVERLEELKSELEERIHIQYMDVSRLNEAKHHLRSLIDQMGGMDLIVLNAGITDFQTDSSWEKEQKIIDVNISGFASLANVSFEYFVEQGRGQLVGISSIASMFGSGLSTGYNASKAFVSSYLQGYRQKANHSDADIAVSDIKPGYVESEMTDGMRGLFWVAPTEKAARQIADAIELKKNHAYVTKRWWLVALLVRMTPNWVFDRM